MAERLLTPSKITAWLDCAHFLTLRHEVDSGVREPAPNTFGEMAEMLLQKGLDHEQAVLEQYRSEGRDVFEVPDWDRGTESFNQWVARIGEVLGAGHDVVFQMPFVHDGVRGIADFLERVVDVDGNVTYEPVDAKLARKEAKPGHVLQLCFYAEAIAAQSFVSTYERIEVGDSASGAWIRWSSISEDPSEASFATLAAGSFIAVPYISPNRSGLAGSFRARSMRCWARRWPNSTRSARSKLALLD